MENIRTNKAARAAALLLVAVLVTTSIIGGTLAKYITKGQGKDTARVAKFGVVATMSGDLFGTSYSYDGEDVTTKTATSKIAKFNGSETNNGFVVNSSQASKDGRVVAPGTYNDKGMTISVKGTPEVATKTEFVDYSGFTDEDIYLAAGEYGVMTAVDSSKTKITADNVTNYYIKDGATYKKATSATELTSEFYMLQDQAKVATAYYPLTWFVKNNNSEEAKASMSKVAEVKAALDAAFGLGYKDPNTALNESYTITWEWPFADDYGDGTDLTTRDRKDTILGDMIAKAVSPDENTHYEVVKLTPGTADYETVTYSGTEATAGNKVANLKTGIGAELTCSQAAKEDSEELAAARVEALAALEAAMEVENGISNAEHSDAEVAEYNKAVEAINNAKTLSGIESAKSAGVAAIYAADFSDAIDKELAKYGDAASEAQKDAAKAAKESIASAADTAGRTAAENAGIDEIRRLAKEAAIAQVAAATKLPNPNISPAEQYYIDIYTDLINGLDVDPANTYVDRLFAKRDEGKAKVAGADEELANAIAEAKTDLESKAADAIAAGKDATKVDEVVDKYNGKELNPGKFSDAKDMGELGDLEETAEEELAAIPADLKGNLIEIKSSDGTSIGKYRVLKTEGDKAFVLGMTPVGGSTIKYNTSSQTTTFKEPGGTTKTLQKYDGSNLDTTLEGFYNGMPVDVKEAIDKVTIDQKAYGWNSTDPGSISKWAGTYGFGSTTNYWITNEGYTATVGDRYVYALDVKDVIDYLGEGNFTAANVNKMFFDTESQKSGSYCWLRSANTNFNDLAFDVFGDLGSLNYNRCNFASEARAAFKIDLSKVTVVPASL